MANTPRLGTTQHNRHDMAQHSGDKARHDPKTLHSAVPLHDTTRHEWHATTRRNKTRQDKARRRPGTTRHNVARHNDTVHIRGC